MGAFAYVAPSSIDEAVSVLAEHAKKGQRAQVLAGGTDLLVQMRGTDREPRTLVDIKKLAETNRLHLGKTRSSSAQPFPARC
jgi:aerobic carbon-monoxide dehydrogenase medium subunit